MHPTRRGTIEIEADDVAAPELTGKQLRAAQAGRSVDGNAIGRPAIGARTKPMGSLPRLSRKADS